MIRKKMGSSSLQTQAHNLTTGALVSPVGAFDSATAAQDKSILPPIPQSLSVINWRPSVHISATLSKVSDVSLSNEHAAISKLYTEDERPLTDDFYSNSGLQFQESGLDVHQQDNTARIKELQLYLDMVKKIVRPGCSEEVLNVALNSMSSLFSTLSMLSSKSKPHASL